MTERMIGMTAGDIVVWDEVLLGKVEGRGEVCVIFVSLRLVRDMIDEADRSVATLNDVKTTDGRKRSSKIG